MTPPTTNKAEAKVIQVSGAELDAHIGDAATIAPSGSKKGLRAAVAGAVNRDFLILRLPSAAKARELFPVGSDVLIKCSSRGAIYGFRSVVLGMVAKPAPLLFVEFPYTMEKIGLRQHSRISCSLPGTGHCRVGEFPMLLVDLSVGGCRVQISKEGLAQAKNAAEEDLILLELRLEQNEELFVGGAIRNIADSAGTVTWGVGFLHMDEEKSEVLTKFIGYIQNFQFA